MSRINHPQQTEGSPKETSWEASGMVAVDKNLEITGINSFFSLLTGFSEADCLGKKLTALEGMDDLPVWFTKEDGNQPKHFKKKLLVSNGISFDAGIRISPEFDSSGVFSGAEITVIKTTENSVTMEEPNWMNENFKLIADNVSDIIVSLDPDWKFLYVNSNFESFSGTNLSEIRGQSALDYFSKFRNRKIFRKILEFRNSNSPFLSVEHFPEVDLWFEIKGIHSPEGMTFFIRDISKKMKLEFFLLNSEQKYKSLFDTNPVCMWFRNPAANKLVEVNKEGIKLLGYTEEEFRGLTSIDIRPDYEAEKFHVQEELNRTQKNYAYQTKLLKKDGSVIDVILIHNRIVLKGEDLVMVAAVDITQEKENEKKLLKSILKAQDLERERMALEIHDSLGQILTAANMTLASLKQQFNELIPEKSHQFDTAMNLISRAMKEGREISHNLMPKTLKDYGLVNTLKETVNILRASGVNIHFSHEGEFDNLEPETAVNLYRISQEALNNILKHAEATRIDLQLFNYDDSLVYIIEDNGKGFAKNDKKSGLGLLGIENRVRVIGGILEINSSPGRGTTLMIEIKK